VQLFTPCTLGNGWMRVLDWDRFALTLYNRVSLRGCRVWLDAGKTAARPAIHDWFLKRVPKDELPLEILLGQILEARRSLLSCRSVIVTDFLRRPKKGKSRNLPGVRRSVRPARGGLLQRLSARRVLQAGQHLIITPVNKQVQPEPLSGGAGCPAKVQDGSENRRRAPPP
jgi:formylmethanofuran dehydrogenase subunit E